MNTIYDEFGRPSWDAYFMDMAFLISQRSIDPDTKHGTAIVDENHTLLSIGYNGPPKGCNDSKIPLTRPEKYDWIIHSELNAILNAAKKGISLDNSIFYVTGMPCEKCIKEIINVGAKKVIYGPIQSKCITEEKLGFIKGIINSNIIEIIKYDGDVGTVVEKTLRYIGNKLN